MPPLETPRPAAHSASGLVFGVSRVAHFPPNSSPRLDHLPINPHMHLLAANEPGKLCFVLTREAGAT